MGHTDVINSCLFNYSRKQIVSGSDDCTVRHWDQMTTKEIRVDKCTDKVINMDISIDENMLATCHNKDVRIWSVPTGKVIVDLKGIHD